MIFNWIPFQCKKNENTKLLFIINVSTVLFCSNWMEWNGIDTIMKSVHTHTPWNELCIL